MRRWTDLHTYLPKLKSTKAAPNLRPQRQLQKCRPLYKCSATLTFTRRKSYIQKGCSKLTSTHSKWHLLPIPMSWRDAHALKAWESFLVGIATKLKATPVEAEHTVFFYPYGFYCQMTGTDGKSYCSVVSTCHDTNCPCLSWDFCKLFSNFSFAHLAVRVSSTLSINALWGGLPCRRKR